MEKWGFILFQESFKTLRDIGETNSMTFDSVMSQFGICQGHKIGGRLLLLMEQESKDSVAKVSTVWPLTFDL